MTRINKAILIGTSIVSGVGISQISGAVPVVDVSAVPNWAQKLANDITQIEKAATTIIRIETLTKNLEYQAQYLKNTASSWGWLTHPWLNASYADSTGLNTGWMGTVNRGVNAVSAYSAIVGQLNTDLHYYPAGFGQDAQRAVAMVERMDGHAQKSATTIGQYTAASSNYQLRIGRLAASTYSSNPDDHTAAALADKTNAALLLQLENANMQAELTRNQLEQSTELLIMQRERLTSEINSNAHFYATVGALTADQSTVPPLRIP